MGVCKSFECHIKVYRLLHRPKIDENDKVPHYYIFMNY
jgi:hypothetical protein